MIVAAAPKWAAVFHRDVEFRRGDQRLQFTAFAPKHFPAKCEADRRGKCDKGKNLERVSDSKVTETALEHFQEKWNPVFRSKMRQTLES
jgi:hypothetical protein